VTESPEEEFEKIALAWRKAAQQDVAPRLDAPAFITWLKQSGYIKDYIRLPDAELPDAKGKYEPNESRLYFRHSVWQGALNGNPHDTFTLIHESSHAILGHQETRLRSALPRLTVAKRDIASDEAAANRLTAALLAPFEMADFAPGMNAAAISKRFGLSLPTAEKRLAEFERIYRRRHGILRPLPPGILDFLNARRPSAQNITNLPLHAFPIAPRMYEGDPCPNCCEFKMVRTGVEMRCDHCGAVTGAD
jgi:hypothetical protein